MKTHDSHASFIRFLILLVAGIMAIAAYAPTIEPQTGSPSLSAQQMENLVAFTRLYGYVRFFHPSDAAAQIDWDKFAIYGCIRMLGCRGKDDLMLQLNQLFAPIAPSVRIYDTRNPEEADRGRTILSDTSRLKIVAWQHLGVGLSPQSVYRSVRLNRNDIRAGGNAYGFGSLTGSLDPLHLRGQRITLKAAVRADKGSRGQLWLRVDRPGGKMGFFDNMGNRPIVSPDWKYYEITGRVDSDAVWINFGCMLIGTGKIWLDDLHMFSGESHQQKEIKLEDTDFENDSLGVMPQGWSNVSPGYAIGVTNETASSGRNSVLIKSTTDQQPSELFPERPSIGESISCDLSGGISCRIPLALLTDSAGTLPRADRSLLDELKWKIEDSIPKNVKGTEPSVRLGGIVIAWNVFQHFYPYFDVAGTNWESELPVALEQAYRDSTEIDFLKTLRRFVAKLNDGHGRVRHASDSSTSYRPPVQWTWTEDNLVITMAFDSSNATPAAGDIVLEVNGIPARRALEEEERFISGATPQWRRFRALGDLLAGSRDSKLELVTVDRAGHKHAALLMRSMSWKQHYDLEQLQRRRTGEIGEKVFYIDLSTTPMSAIDSLMPDLVRARGIICDLRGYPNGNHDLISHLLTVPDTSTHWMAIPKTIYPDRKRAAGYVYAGWQIQPKQPHIGGKVVFLTDGRAISYAESYMSFIEHYGLADIVGEPTAGTNGNVNPFALPGGYVITWTGMKVTKHDGSRHHGVGIQPTLLVRRTIYGIREGRDEQLDAALALINKTSR